MNEPAPFAAGPQAPSQAWGLKTWLLLFAVLAPALTAMVVLQRGSPGLPYHDDYGPIVNFSANAETIHGLWHKVGYILAAQHNEYKLITLHVLTLADLRIEHHLDFPLAITVGNFLLLPLGLVLWFMFEGTSRPLQRKLLHFLPISFLFFALPYWEAMDWAMTE